MCMSSFLYPFPFCHPMSVVTCSPWLDPAEWLRANHWMARAKNLSIYPSIHTRPSIIYPSICISLIDGIYASIYPSIHPSTHQSIYLSIQSSVCPFIYPFVIFRCNHLCIYIYICISFYFYVYVSLRCECTISLSRDISWVWAVLCMFFAIIQSGFIYLVLK